MHQTAPLSHFRISSQHHPPIFLTATDWMTAIGTALHRLGRVGGIRRLACEQVGNGDIIVNDLTNRLRYVIQEVPPVIADAYEDEVTELLRM
jgi:hypothetical protein